MPGKGDGTKTNWKPSRVQILRREFGYVYDDIITIVMSQTS